MSEPKKKPASGPSLGRRRLFYIITWLFPLALLGGVELALRSNGYGEVPPLFIDAVGLPGHLQANPDVLQRYFPDKDQTPPFNIDRIPFKKVKPNDVFRVVVQGESSAAGFPYGRFGGLAGMLHDRLEATFPDRELEVITTGLSGTTSYTMLDFVDEILAISPDVVLIYGGHNEFVGILGVGSGLSGFQSRGLTLLNLKLREVRLYRWLQGVIARRRSPIDKSGPPRNMMARIAAAGKDIPLQSDLYRAGVEQFRGNLDLILGRYANAGIPVIIGTLASNERDLRPFAGAAARALYDEAKALEGQGDLEGARSKYLAAKDADELRFRAPEEFNEVIRAVAADHGATVVDVRARLAAESPGGIIGKEMMWEHVHPRKRGYFLLTDAYYVALRERGFLGDWSGAPSLEEAWHSVPLTPVDDVAAAFTIERLLADFPFRDEPVPAPLPRRDVPLENLAYLALFDQQSPAASLREQVALYRQQGDGASELLATRIFSTLIPTHHESALQAGIGLGNSSRPGRAAPYLRRAIATGPADPRPWRALIGLELHLGQRDKAKELIQELTQKFPENPDLPMYRAALALTSP